MLLGHFRIHVTRRFGLWTLAGALANPLLADYGLSLGPPSPDEGSPFVVAIGGVGSCPSPVRVETIPGAPWVLEVEIADGCLTPPEPFLIEVPAGPLHQGAWRLDAKEGDQVIASLEFTVSAVPLALRIEPDHPRAGEQVDLIVRYSEACGLVWPEPVWQGRLVTLTSELGGCTIPIPGPTEHRVVLGTLAPGTYRAAAFEEAFRGQRATLPFTVLAEDACFYGPEVLCLLGGRFQVSATWRTTDRQGQAQSVPLTADTGAFWFFTPDNLELTVKVLDGCSQAQPRFWVFASGLTNVEVDLEVFDTVTGERWTHHHGGGLPFPPILDTSAFATCDAVAD